MTSYPLEYDSDPDKLLSHQEFWEEIEELQASDNERNAKFANTLVWFIAMQYDKIDKAEGRRDRIELEVKLDPSKLKNILETIQEMDPAEFAEMILSRTPPKSTS